MKFKEEDDGGGHSTQQVAGERHHGSKLSRSQHMDRAARPLRMQTEDAVGNTAPDRYGGDAKLKAKQSKPRRQGWEEQGPGSTRSSGRQGRRILQDWAWAAVPTDKEQLKDGETGRRDPGHTNLINTDCPFHYNGRPKSKLLHGKQEWDFRPFFKK